MTEILPFTSSPAALPETSPLRRLPHAPSRRRPQEFYENYDALTLFYDCFLSADRAEILLVGPPHLNLAPLLDEARFEALPGRAALQPQFHPSASVMLTRLPSPPAGTTAIRIAAGDFSWELPVQPSSAAALHGKKILFTLSKNNELDWIAEWARYHAQVQGADAVIFFDNGSTRYTRGEIEDRLRAVSGLDAIAVLQWPQIYGAPDRQVVLNPFYTHFLQIGAMSVVLRRYGAAAAGLLNCDVDELAVAPEGETVFSRLAKSPHGLLVMRGQFVEAVPADGAPERRTHRHYLHRLRNPARRFSHQKKWALDPTRPWVSAPTVFPYMHWIEGRPRFAKTTSRDVFYWHFRGISTNWKDNRSSTAHLSAPDLEPDHRLALTMSALAGS